MCGRTSWGVSTTMMGALVMTHSDESWVGFALRNLAQYKVVIVPYLQGIRAVRFNSERAAASSKRSKSKRDRLLNLTIGYL